MWWHLVIIYASTINLILFLTLSFWFDSCLTRKCPLKLLYILGKGANYLTFAFYLKYSRLLRISMALFFFVTSKRYENCEECISASSMMFWTCLVDVVFFTWSFWEFIIIDVITGKCLLNWKGCQMSQYIETDANTVCLSLPCLSF